MNEINKFDQFASEWWNTQGSLKILHKINLQRVKYIISTIKARNNAANPSTIQNMHIADIGCGGGILSERLHDIGGRVVGIDANLKAIESAKDHLIASRKSGITYINGTVNTLANNLFDVVTAMEIIEHVNDRSDFIQQCIRITKPGGILFIATINKNYKSLLLAKITAEYILRMIPAGTHDFRKFIKPESIVDIMRLNGMNFYDIVGVSCSPLTMRWSLTKNTEVNYIICGVKNK